MSLSDAKLRILAICQATALAEGYVTNGSVRFTYHLDEFPYFVLRAGPALHDWYGTQQIRTITREIIIRLVVDHVTAGYRGEREDIIDALLAPLAAAFDMPDGRMLVSAAYPIHPIYLHPLGVNTTSDTGLQIFEAQGIEGNQIGTEITLSVPFIQDTEA